MSPNDLKISMPCSLRPAITGTCLAAIWAMQAGKDVYVEKPLSHTQWEGRQVVQAARKYGRMVQVGTQQRPIRCRPSKTFLHEDKALGNIQYAQANRLGVREPIGKLAGSLPIPKEVNYDLWLGPAADEPLRRDNLHYDWHWVFNTGNGEMGNWGVHVLDDVRNVAYRDSVSLPSGVFAVGGRLAWDDAGRYPQCALRNFRDRFISHADRIEEFGDQQEWKGCLGYQSRPAGIRSR